MPTESQIALKVDELSNVGKLVHLAFRYDSVMVDEYSSLIFREMKKHYERNLTRHARRLGCKKVARLGESPELEQLRAMAKTHGESIARTYNYDLTYAVQTIRTEVPRANRFTYAKRLNAWEGARANWKDSQIALMSAQFAMQLATEHFYERNAGQLSQRGARLMPRRAAEIECQALINAGLHPASIVREIPMPLHFNCVHHWEFEKAKVDCERLWVGS